MLIRLTADSAPWEHAYRHAIGTASPIAEDVDLAAWWRAATAAVLEAAGHRVADCTSQEAGDPLALGDAASEAVVSAAAESVFRRRYPAL